MGTKAHSLAHTKWLCKYHIVFTPKYRRKIIFAQLRESIKEILQCLCKYKGVEILEGHLMPDHVHMLVSIPPKISVANFMGYLKGKSSLMIFDKHANLKYKFGNRKFWAEGYYVSTVWLNEKKKKKYIQDQDQAVTAGGRGDGRRQGRGHECHSSVRWSHEKNAVSVHSVWKNGTG